MGDHAFSAAAVGGINFSTPLDAIACFAATTAGSAHSGTGMSGLYSGASPEDHPLTAASSTWSGCSEQFGTPLNFQQNGPWHFITQDTTVTTSAADLVTGTVTGIALHITDATGLCDFWAVGSVDATFDESTQRLTLAETVVDGSLTIDNVAGDCLGSFALGDPADLYITYAINIPDGPLNIS